MLSDSAQVIMRFVSSVWALGYRVHDKVAGSSGCCKKRAVNDGLECLPCGMSVPQRLNGGH